MNTKILIFLVSLFSIFSLQTMEREFTDDLEMEHVTCDHADRNAKVGSIFTSGGFSLCLFGVALQAPMLAAVGAVSCWNGLHHCAIAWNDVVEPADNCCESNMQSAIRFIFCLRTAEDEL